MGRIYLRDTGSTDGVIYSAASGDLGNAATRYIYFDCFRQGYLHFNLQHIITNTTLTFETCENAFQGGQTVRGVATSTDGTGATLVSSTLNSVAGFVADTDLIGIRVRITKDNTTPSNIGLTRTVTAYTGASGTLTLDSAFGATTSGVTEYQLEDNPSPWGRIVNDPTASKWVDVTSMLFGVASATSSGLWIQDSNMCIERGRVKAVTTNATNALELRLTRGR